MNIQWTLAQEIGTGFWQDGVSNWGYWSYLLLAVLVAVEGPVATLAGAAAAAGGVMRLPGVFVAASLGNLTADILWYWIGYSGRTEKIYRYGRWIGLRPHQIRQLERRMQQNAAKVLLIAKLTAGLVIPTLIAAGLVRAPWRKWFSAVFTGEMVWTGTLVLLGYFATASLWRIEQGIRYAVLGGSVLFILLVLYALRQIRGKKDS